MAESNGRAPRVDGARAGVWPGSSDVCAQARPARLDDDALGAGLRLPDHASPGARMCVRVVKGGQVVAPRGGAQVDLLRPYHADPVRRVERVDDPAWVARNAD